MLGIARKAGMLAIGSEDVAAAARSRKAKAILTASDASESARRRAARDSEFCGATHTVLPYTKYQLGNITGRGSPGTLAILDAGLAARFLEGLTQEQQPHTLKGMIR
jgi:ribosomal protein L30E